MYICIYIIYVLCYIIILLLLYYMYYIYYVYIFVHLCHILHIYLYGMVMPCVMQLTVFHGYAVYDPFNSVLFWLCHIMCC